MKESAKTGKSPEQQPFGGGRNQPEQQPPEAAHPPPERTATLGEEHRRGAPPPRPPGRKFGFTRVQGGAPEGGRIVRHTVSDETGRVVRRWVRVFAPDGQERQASPGGGSKR